MAAVAAMERRFIYDSDAVEDGGVTKESLGNLDAGLELAVRGARRAVMNFWGRLHGFITQLGDPKRRWAAMGRHHPILRVTRKRV
jgi:hypothetical protein